MKKGLLILMLLMLTGAATKTRLSISPRFANAPATITFLLMGIPDNAKVVCFVLDGDNLYSSCQEVDGRQSIRIEYRNVRQGNYGAAASIDGQLTPTQEVKVTGLGFDPSGEDGD